ncbi:MAG TPA: GAF domain-containing protein [Thermomicrobiaceae bacterium]|nr:GAF domain-containing protein [Thermomicrobiaceae bacterium]
METNVDNQNQLRRLKWIAILAPLLFLTLVELARDLLYPDLFRSWPGYLLVAGAVLLGTLFFSEAIFGVIGAMQRSLASQNQELLALHESGMSITRALDLKSVLQQVVEEARDLVGARYGALALLRSDGQGMEAFLTSGITPEERALQGPIPSGHGLLGLVIEEARPLRLGDLSTHPRSVGFPPNHPVMRSLVAVPIRSHDRVLGSLYLTEKEGAAEFDAADQARLERFATQAALAIENARLHQEVRALAVVEERERIAREMHDSIAQVLGYVNTKAQAAQGFIRAGKPERAEEQIGQLATAAREAYADVRENILGLRSSLGPERDFLDVLADYLGSWQDQSGVVVRWSTEPAQSFRLGLSPMAELQLLRIIQESLANVRKHAQASQVEIRLRLADEVVDVTVNDNGIGFAPAAPGRTGVPRFGLATMHERAESVGGSVEIRSQPGAGTTVHARLPRPSADLAQTQTQTGARHAHSDR